MRFESARKEVGLFWRDKFTDQGGIHPNEWGKPHLEFEELWREYMIFLWS